MELCTLQDKGLESLTANNMQVIYPAFWAGLLTPLEILRFTVLLKQTSLNPCAPYASYARTRYKP